jgi:thermostable 8-oxoguanine DNA glycosylase
MELIWKLNDSDINRIRDFIKRYNSPAVEKIINRNINHIDTAINKDSVLKVMLICLLSSDTDSYPERIIEQMVNEKPYLLNYEYLLKVRNIEYMFQEAFKTYGITKYLKKVPNFFSTNLDFLFETNWNLEKEINSSLERELTKNEERELADRIDRSFKGFGSKEARSFLLALGVTRYEIPIDYKLIKWLKAFDFPIKFSKIALQDILFYHFVSDGIQKLCEISEIYPCVLYSSVMSGYEL